MATPADHIRTVANRDGAAILDPRSGTITTLNASGAFIWEALRRGEHPTSIAAALASETGESVERIEADLREFLQTLAAKNLVTADDGGRA